jgi:hypothetical protein
MRTPRSLLTAVLAALLAAPAPGRAGASGADLTVTFVNEDGTRDRAGSAVLDVGSVSASWPRGGRGRRAEAAAVVSRRVGVRVESRSGRRGFVRLRAFLAMPAQRGAVSVDGFVLTTAPRIVDAQAPIGATVGHIVKVSVPARDPAGALSADIVWEVEEQ